MPAASLPAAGAIAAGMVVLATSSSAAPPVSLGAPKAPEPDRPQAADQLAPRVTGGLPSSYEAAGVVENLDDAGAVIPAVFTGDIPATVLKAYQHARDLINAAQPGCHLPLELLEAIGKVETGHARHGQVDPTGRTLTPILGPVLDGNGFAAITDTDAGRYDGDRVWDRAVGPMQFIPSTWAGWFSDGNGDGLADPHNVYDASLAAARYLCAANRDLGTPEGLDSAIYSYNHSTSYRNLVLAWMSTYSRGTIVVPDGSMIDPRGSTPALTVPPPVQQAAVQPAEPPTPTTPPAEPPPTTPPTSTPPTTTPPTTTPPTTTPPATPPTTTPPAEPPTTTPPPETSPPSEPAPAPTTGVVQGLVTGVTGLVGGLLGGGS